MLTTAIPDNCIEIYGCRAQYYQLSQQTLSFLHLLSSPRLVHQENIKYQSNWNQEDASELR